MKQIEVKCNMDNNSIVEDCITKALYKLIDKKKLENITIKELV